MKLEAKEFCKRLDAALANRRSAENSGELVDAKCEVCGDNIHRYQGTYPGIICTSCLELSGEGSCTRIAPLAITRGTLNE